MKVIRINKEFKYEEETEVWEGEKEKEKEKERKEEKRFKGTHVGDIIVEVYVRININLKVVHAML